MGEDELLEGDDTDLPVDGRDDDEEEAGPSKESQLTAKKLHREHVESWKERFEPHRYRLERNERFIMGEQFSDLDKRGSRENVVVWNEGVPKIPRNYLRKLAATYASRLEEESGTAKTFPHDFADLQLSEVTNAILAHLHQLQDLPSMMYRGAMLAQPHTLVGFKTTWDATAGATSRWTGEPMGSVVFDLLDVFSFGMSDDEHVENASWCYFCRPVDWYVALHMLEQAGINEKPSKDDVTFGGGGDRKQVLAYEHWVRRGARVPQGLYSVIVGGHAVEASPFSYDHDELPLSVWKIGDRRDSALGSTHVDDAVPLQVYVNQLVSVITKLTWDVGNIRLLAVPEIVDKMRKGNHAIKVSDPKVVQDGARYLDPPNPPPLIFGQLEESIKALHDLFGLNETLLGRQASDQSGKAIAYLNRLDGMALKGSLLNRSKTVIRMMRQALGLMKQYASLEHIAMIAGDVDTARAEAFQGADLNGLDIVIEAAPGSVHSQAVSAEDADQLGMTGAIPPDQWREQRRTGLRETGLAGWQRQMAQQQVQATMQGQQLPADPNVDPQVALEVIADAAAQAMQNGKTPADPVVQALFALAAQYRMMAQQQGMPPPPSGGPGPSPQEQMAAQGQEVPAT